MENIKNINISEYKNLEMIQESCKGYVMKGLNKSGEIVLLKSFFKTKANLYSFINDSHFNKLIPKELFYLCRLTGKPFVPKLLEYHDEVDLATVVMEYLDKDWSDLLNFMLEFNDEDLIKIVMKNVILVMYEMAKMGFYHCDIKPENIMVNHITLEVKFIDLEDLCFNRSPNPLNIGPKTGTMGYKSPESYPNKSFELLPALVFNIGCVLYVCHELKLAYTSIPEGFECESFQMTLTSKPAESLIRLCN